MMIILFCGVPGCGKTTIAKLLAARLAAAGSVQLLTSDELKSPVYRKLFGALAPERRTCDFIILDATFYRREWRERVSALCGPEELVTVYVECPVDLAVERNRARQPRLADKVVHIMSRRMQAPEHPTIKIDSTAMTPSEAADRIFNFIQTRCSEWQFPSRKDLSSRTQR